MNPPTTVQSALAMEMSNVVIGGAQGSGRAVIEDVNWSVTPGDFWVIGGLQGAGKSDFLRTAGGLVPPQSGTYQFFGEAMPIFEDERLAERLRLGFVFDGGQLFNHLTLSENVGLPLRYHRNLTAAESEAQVRQMLAWTELESLAGSTPGAIGRNWQQRAGLARALMLKPEVLLLDNPLAGLDHRHRAWWVNFLDQLSRGHECTDHRRITLVVTADDLHPWRKRARQFAILKNRRFVILGPWEAIKATQDESVKELLAATAQAE